MQIICTSIQTDNNTIISLWPPYVIGLAIIFLPCGFFLSFFFSLPNVSGRKTQKPLKLAGVPKLTKRSQPLVGRSSPYCEDMWGRYCCLTSFFPIVDTCLSYEDISRHSLRWCPDGQFLAIFWVLHFQQSACSTFQTCILNLH